MHNDTAGWRDRKTQSIKLRWDMLRWWRSALAMISSLASQYSNGGVTQTNGFPRPFKGVLLFCTQTLLNTFTSYCSSLESLQVSFKSLYLYTFCSKGSGAQISWNMARLAESGKENSAGNLCRLAWAASFQPLWTTRHDPDWWISAPFLWDFSRKHMAPIHGQMPKCQKKTSKKQRQKNKANTKPTFAAWEPRTPHRQRDVWADRRVSTLWDADRNRSSLHRHRWSLDWRRFPRFVDPLWKMWEKTMWRGKWVKNLGDKQDLWLCFIDIW